jgi:hypothetical protein
MLIQIVRGDDDARVGVLDLTSACRIQIDKVYRSKPGESRP